jgi:ABC-type antimicrobial peptide transport system permease subunit
VVKDTKYQKIDEKLLKVGYLAMAQDPDPWAEVCYEIRSEQPFDGLIPSLRTAISLTNRDIALEFRDYEIQVEESLVQQRMLALLSLAFGSLALVLSMVGLYGITAYSVAQRRAEIGIRMALGARPQSVVWLVLRDVVMLLLIGVGVGAIASLVAGKLITSLLFNVRPSDPWQLSSTALVLFLGATLASCIPARRAARLDPMAALREG